MAKKALGKGLGALLASQESNQINKNEVRENDVNELPISSIEPNKLQPRKYFDEDRLKELAESIKEKGLIQPIVVTKKENDKYEIIVGERRWRACQIIGLKRIPALIKEASNFELLELALVENIQRHDLNSIEEAVSYKELIENLNLTQEQLSTRIGKSRTAIANTMRLLKLPDEIQKEIIQENISEGHGRSLLSLKDEEHIDKVKEKIVEESLSVRQTEKLIQEVNESGISVLDKEKNVEELENVNSDEIIEAPQDESVEGGLLEEAEILEKIQGNLTDYFKCNVKLKSKKNQKGGKIEISYKDKEDLNRIIQEVLRISKSQAE